MSKIREFAKGKPCTVMIEGICNHDPETSVMAHLNGSGMAMKDDDIFVAICCSACHDALDGRRITDYTYEELHYAHLRGMTRTQRMLLKAGLITYA